MSPTCLRAALVLPALLGVAGCEQRSAGYFRGYSGAPDRGDDGKDRALHHERGIMLKGNQFADLWPNVWPILAFTIAVIGLGLGVYRRTLG